MKAACRTVAAVAAVLAASFGVAGAQTQSDQKTGVPDRGSVRGNAPKPPPVGALVTLAVYSGRPNPSWTIEPGPELDRLTALIKDLRPADTRLFDYDEWNRLGYATFWIEARGLPGTGRIHVWRDMAYFPSKEGKGSQAIGAAKLYEMLVTQAESKGQEAFFRNYRKLPPAKPGAR
jgi:hypothetical protein